MKTKEIENLYLNVGALNISNQHYINIFTNYYLIGKSQVKMADDENRETKNRIGFSRVVIAHRVSRMGEYPCSTLETPKIEHVFLPATMGCIPAMPSQPAK